MPTNLFGPIVDESFVEDAAEAILRKWMPTYLAEIARRSGVTPGELPLPRSYTRADELNQFPEDQLPSIILVSPGLYEPPERKGDGKFNARFALGVGVIVSANTRANTDKLAKRYTAAVRALIVQRPSFDGAVSGVQWLDERFDDLDFDDARTLVAGQTIFAVAVDNVLDAFGGPADPSTGGEPEDDPVADPGPWPTVPDRDHIDIELQEEGLPSG